MAIKTTKTKSPKTKKGKMTLKPTTASAKDVADAPVAEAAPVDLPKADQDGPDAVPTIAALKKPEMIAQIAARAGIKKKDAKVALQATLGIIAEAIMEGRDVQSPELGAIKVKRMKDTPNGKIAIAKIRPSTRPAMTAPVDAGE